MNAPRSFELFTGRKHRPALPLSRAHAERFESRLLLAAPVVGDVWQRPIDWTAPPASDAGTTNGNPDADAKGNAIWQYESLPLARGMGEPTTGGAAPNPWYAGAPTKLTWDNSWFGQPAGGWTGGNDVGPLIQDKTLIQLANNSRVPLVRWLNPTASGVTVALSGVLSLSWNKYTGSEMMSPIDFVMMLQRPDGSISPLVIANRKPPAFTLQPGEVDDGFNTDVPSIWIDLPAVKVPAGGSIFYTLRYEDATSRPGWLTLDDRDFTITLKALSAIPLTANDSSVTNVDRTINTEVLANDKWDPRALPRVAILSSPIHGLATVRADQSIDYTPAAGYFGADVLTYQLSDGSATNTATLSITVNQPYYLYVKPTGNDSSAGTSWSTALASLNGARQKIRALRTQTPSPIANKSVEVIFDDGVYPTNWMVSFDATDSGSAQYPVTYRARNPLSATISAAKPLNLSWQPYAPMPGAYVADLSATGISQDDFNNINSLFVNNSRAARAREPDVGYFTILSADPATRSNTFTFGDTNSDGQQDILSNWTNLQDVEIVSYALWTESRMPISSVNDATHQVTTQGSTDYLNDYGAIRDKFGNLTGTTDGTIRYYVENVLQGLDTPGEWYLDPTAKQLYYYPRAGESISTSIFAVPSLKWSGGRTGTLLSISGTTNVRFDGLTFADTDWSMPATGQSGSQAAGTVTAQDAITLAAGASNVLFTNGRITRTAGAYGIRLKADASGNSALGMEFLNNGGGGVAIAYIGPTPYTGNNRIALNNIHDNNLVWREAVGIFSGPNGYNRVTANTLSNLTYNGIAMGWFDSDPLAPGHNQILWNTISNFNTVLYDGGGIYALGAQPFTTIMGNKVTGGLWTANHLKRTGTTYPDGSYTNRPPGPAGLYADETASGQRIMGNIIYNNVWGIFLHRNRDEIVTDNIFADSREIAIYLGHWPGTLHSGPAWFESNVIAWTASLPNATRLFDTYSRSPAPWMSMNRDLISYGPATIESPSTYGLPYLQSIGRDQQAALTTDPLFVNPAANDYRIRRSAQTLASQQAFAANWLFEPAPAPSALSLQINDGAAQRSKINSLTLTFDRPVSLTLAAINLALRGKTIAFSINLSPSGTFSTTYTLTFSGPGIIGGSLPDGAYTLTLKAASILDPFNQPLSGGNRTFKFHRLFGDINGDRQINATDLSFAKQALNRSASTFWYLNYDGLGLLIDKSDYQQVRARQIKPLL